MIRENVEIRSIWGTRREYMTAHMRAYAHAHAYVYTVCVRVRARAHGCMGACVRGCVRACVRAFVSKHTENDTLEDADRKALSDTDHKRSVEHVDVALRFDKPLFVLLKLLQALRLPIRVLQRKLAAPLAQLRDKHFGLEHQRNDRDDGCDRVADLQQQH